MSLQQVQDVFLPLLEDLNTPRTLSVSLLVKHGEWDQLCRMTSDPAQYLTADDYFASAVATSFLRKCKGILSTVDTEAEAVKGFYAAEKQCCETNARLDKFLHNGPFGPRDFRIASFLDDVKRFVSRTLGPLPRTLDFRFGPGATFSDRGRKTTVLDKMSHAPQITSSAQCLLPLWEGTAWQRAVARDVYRSAPEIVRGNRFTTVPKDSLKDRGIAVEPSFNISAQLSLGSELKSRLARIGIDLKHGQDRHRLLVCEASRKGHLATIDLSSASDTVSTTLVELLLGFSPEWYAALSCLRSTHTRVGDKWVRLEKFSSMGNGFTFELETLVFLSLAYCYIKAEGGDAVIGEDLLVYGDDIIMPTEYAAGFLHVLRYFGFTPNPKKTFTAGCFRESCGADFFDGHPVRPHFLEEIPDEISKWISLANGIRRTASQFTGLSDELGPFTRAWLRCLSHIPSDVRRCRGPVQLGDLVIHDREKSWSSVWRGQVRYFRIWRPVLKRIPILRWNRFPSVQLAAALYGVPSTGVTPRGGVSGYRFGRVPLTVLSDCSYAQPGWVKELVP